MHSPRRLVPVLRAPTPAPVPRRGLCLPSLMPGYADVLRPAEASVQPSRCGSQTRARLPAVPDLAHKSPC